MLFAAFAVLTLGLSSALAGPFSNSTNICGTTISDDEIIAAEAHFAKNKVSLDLKARAEYAVNIKIYWHVVQSGPNYIQGNTPDSQIKDSITALNKFYNGTGFTFTLASTDRTTNRPWFDSAGRGTRMQTKMKNALRRGNAADLNVYTVGFTFVDPLGGYATFPGWYEDNPKDDGVVMLYSTLIGGSMIGDEIIGDRGGKVLVHEVGHWLGLYHTFQGGCRGQGDYVDDTPAQADQTFGCVVGQDTCPSPGVDPIHNFMGYDDCKNEFTPGQITRMRDQVATYRGIQP